MFIGIYIYIYIYAAIDLTETASYYVHFYFAFSDDLRYPLIIFMMVKMVSYLFLIIW